jgi:hypothetical protein
VSLTSAFGDSIEHQNFIMRDFLVIWVLFIFYSCEQDESTKKETPLILKEYQTPLLDSFNTRNLDIESSIRYDILLDTIYIPQNKNHMGISIIYPRLSQDEYPEVSSQIDNLIRRQKKEFYEAIKGEKTEYDTSLKMYRGWDLTIRPMSLYQTEKVVSFGIEKFFGSTGMSSAFEYNVVNYDLLKKKKILLGDYFLLNTLADTIYLKNIISRAISYEFSKQYLDALNFSFDDQYVYFYFDKYNIFAWGTRSIKKKYILDHINPEYR